MAMKDNLLSTSLDDITQSPRKVRAAERTPRSEHTRSTPYTQMIGLAAARLNSDADGKAESDFVLKKRPNELSSRSCLLLFMGTRIHPANILAYKE